MVPWAQPSPYPKQHFDWFSHFCKTSGCNQQNTHTHTHTIGHILCCAEAMWPNNKNVAGYYYRAAFTMTRLKSPKTCHWKPPKWYIKIHFNHYIVFSPYCRNRRWWHLAGRHYGAWQTALWRPTPADDKGHTVALAHDSTPANDSSQMTTQWHLY